MAKIIVQDTEITVLSEGNSDYISLTDMAGARKDDSRAADVIKNWIRIVVHWNFLVPGRLFIIPILSGRIRPL